MFGLTDFDIDFLTGTPVIAVLALVALLGLSVLLYYRTNPPLQGYKRILLGALRVVAVLALIGALLEPVIHFSRAYEREPEVAVLLDYSASMDRSELGKTRTERLDSLLSAPAYDLIRSRTNVNQYLFADSLVRTAVKTSRDKTALGDAIHELSRRELAEPSDLWILFSDGNSNTGRQPAAAARGLNVPILAVDMANDVGSFDVGLDEIDFNPVVFVGRKTKISVKLNWHSASGQTFMLRLMDRDEQLDEARYTLSQEDGLGEVELSYVPDEPGQKLLHISIPTIEGEESAGNNERTIAVKVLKSRIAVLLVTEQPDYEVGFLNRFLNMSDKYDVDLISLGHHAGNLGGHFPATQTELNRYDVVILHDPDPASLTAYRQQIASYLSERGGAMWVMMGPLFAQSARAEWFNKLLPFSPVSDRSFARLDLHGEPVEGHLFHPAVRLADDRAGIRETWANLPPFKSIVRCADVDPNGVVLAVAAGQSAFDSGMPLLGYKRQGPGKVMTSTALPFWPWDFVNLGFGEDTQSYHRFMEGVLSWLTIPEDFDPIRIRPEREVFSRGEMIRFEGFAYDQGFRPIPGVAGEVSLKADQDGSQFQADLIERGEGKFVAEFSQIPPGRYSYEASFEKGGQVLRQTEGEILVETFSLEEFDQGGDPSTLMAVARMSGGEYATYRQFDKAVNALDLSTIVESEDGEISVWGRFWLLLIFIGALGAEWLLRKFNHLI
jgi:hypothetical protein